MIDIDRHPSPRKLVVFATILVLLLVVVGALRWHANSPRTAIVAWIAAAVFATVCIAMPTARRRLYVGWMLATAPIGWVVSHAVLLAIHGLVATPIALILRVTRRDPLRRRFDRDAPSYWIARDPAPERTRYFRQS